MKVLDLEEDWDFLIVLDACRYDFFDILHSNLFDGILEKRYSKGIDTPSWFKETFKNPYRDVIYISGNPYINSKVPISGCDANRKFFKVIDVWDSSWDDNLGTVPPWNLTYEALVYVNTFQKNKFIFHYLQPHAPYISSRFRSIGFPKPEPNRGNVLKRTASHKGGGLYEKFAHKAAYLAVKMKLSTHPWLVLEKLGVPPVSPMDAVRRLYGINGLKEAYKENLMLVLKYVAVLVDAITKMKPTAKIMITADHGELLGEDGLFSHGIDHPLIRIVPWFRVRGVKRVPKDAYEKVVKLVLKRKLNNIKKKLLTKSH